jgi:hypothetical protein
MVRVSEIEHSVTEHNHQFFMLSHESSSKWIIVQFHDHTVSRPLPKLRLRSPELFTITTNYQGRALLLSLLFVFLSPLLIHSWQLLCALE